MTMYRLPSGHVFDTDTAQINTTAWIVPEGDKATVDAWVASLPLLGSERLPEAARCFPKPAADSPEVRWPQSRPEAPWYESLKPGDEFFASDGQPVKFVRHIGPPERDVRGLVFTRDDWRPLHDERYPHWDHVEACHPIPEAFDHAAWFKALQPGDPVEWSRDGKTDWKPGKVSHWWTLCPGAMDVDIGGDDTVGAKACQVRPIQGAKAKPPFRISEHPAVAEADSLRETIAAKDADLLHLRSIIERWEGEHHQEIAAKDAEIVRLKKSGERLDVACFDYEKTTTAQKAEIALLKGNIDRKNETLDAHEKTIAELRGDVERINDSRCALSRDYGEAALARTELTREVTSLRAQLETERAKLHVKEDADEAHVVLMVVLRALGLGDGGDRYVDDKRLVLAAISTLTEERAAAIHEAERLENFHHDVIVALQMGDAAADGDAAEAVRRILRLKAQCNTKPNILVPSDLREIGSSPTSPFGRLMAIVDAFNAEVE